jgi:hypothetical protein
MTIQIKYKDIDLTKYCRASGARALYDMLRTDLNVDAVDLDSYVLSCSMIEEMERHFLGRTSSHLFLTDETSSPDPATIEDTDYWLEHARFTSDLMKAYAVRHNKNIVLYGQMGRIHDVDYLKHPHNSKESGDTAIHPVPAVVYLLERGVPPVISIAIMEHAGYIGAGKNYSTQLSAALSACDDLATYAAAFTKEEIIARNELSEEAIYYLDQIRPIRYKLDASTCATRVAGNPKLFINDSLACANSLAMQSL